MNNVQFQVGGDLITIKYHDKNNVPIVLSNDNKLHRQ